MAYKRLHWKRDTNVFGTTVSLESADKTLKFDVVDNLDFDPIKQLSPRLKTGYQFRCPEVDPNLLEDALRGLQQICGKINIWAEYDTKKEKVTAYAVVEDRSDAAMFAYSQVELWQKWSVAQQEEARAEAKRKPQKVKLNKDGTVTIRVTTTTLDGEEDHTGL